eukprot:4409782-Pyramimonas_sp.AAC.1
MAQAVSRGRPMVVAAHWLWSHHVVVAIPTLHHLLEGPLTHCSPDRRRRTVILNTAEGNDAFGLFVCHWRT